MLKNAYLYEDEIRRKFFEVWYDPKYQYYFGGANRFPFTLSKDENCDGLFRDFASVKDDKVLGYISYKIDPSIKLAYSFGAINFSDEKILFGLDLLKAVDDIFHKFKLDTLEISIIRGNPVEESYDRLIEKCGGRIVGIRHDRAMGLDGRRLDDKLYEIRRENYCRQ